MSSGSWATGIHAIAAGGGGRPRALGGGRLRERTATSFPCGRRRHVCCFGASRDRIHRRKRGRGRSSTTKAAAPKAQIIGHHPTGGSGGKSVSWTFGCPRAESRSLVGISRDFNESRLG